jgi:hypothetical protein
MELGIVVASLTLGMILVLFARQIDRMATHSSFGRHGAMVAPSLKIQPLLVPADGRFIHNAFAGSDRFRFRGIATS